MELSRVCLGQVCPERGGGRGLQGRPKMVWMITIHKGAQNKIFGNHWFRPTEKTLLAVAVQYFD